MPVVARAAGGLREAVVDGVTGLLVEGDDPAVWAAAAAGVLGDAELAGRMGRAGRESALARNWEASTAALLETYRELLG